MLNELQRPAHRHFSGRPTQARRRREQRIDDAGGERTLRRREDSDLSRRQGLTEDQVSTMNAHEVMIGQEAAQIDGGVAKKPCPSSGSPTMKRMPRSSRTMMVIVT